MKTCPRCGSPNDDNYAVCSSCGLDLPQAAPTVAPVHPTTPGAPNRVRPTQVAGLKESSLGPVLLIAGLVGFFIIGPLVGPVVWILAAVEKKKIARGELAPSGAITGALIVGVVETCILGVVILGVIIMFFWALRMGG